MNEKILRVLTEAADVGEENDPRPPEFSDEALALRFADEHKDDLRYVAIWGRWLSWDGKRWQFDDTLSAFDSARKICRRASAEYNKPSAAQKIASAKTVAAVATLARADRQIAARADQWDADPWLLNTPGGVVDLRTGELRPARREDYMTKIAAVAPDETCPCPIWDAFLKKIVPDDLAAYLYRVFGYALTGSTTEQVLFFLWGAGKNGKSVLVSTITGILNDYHRTTPIDTFMATNAPQHPTDLAGLQGARLVTAVETEKGRRWAQSRINMMTGGDKISARFMRQDFFDYAPQFKLAIFGNHKPALRSVNEAIRRRMNLIPFTVTIPENERDFCLAIRLREEWPGILKRAIDGCLEWQRGGLGPPKVVTDATEEYLLAEDVMEAWIEDCCERVPTGFEERTKLFDSWRSWAEKAEEFVGSSKQFYHALQEKGFERHKSVGNRGFKGLRLRTVEQKMFTDEMPTDELPY